MFHSITYGCVIGGILNLHISGSNLIIASMCCMSLCHSTPLTSPLQFAQNEYWLFIHISLCSVLLSLPKWALCFSCLRPNYTALGSIHRAMVTTTGGLLTCLLKLPLCANEKFSQQLLVYHVGSAH